MKLLKLFMLFLGLAGALAGGLSAYYLGGTGRGPEQVFLVERGDNYAQLAAKLQAKGIIRSERAFRWYVTYAPGKRSLKRGEYLLKGDSSVQAVVGILNEGKAIEHTFTVPEGYNIYQIAEKLQAEGYGQAKNFLKAVRSPALLQRIPTLRPGEKLPPSLEGYLFPDTYSIEKGDTEAEIAEIMLERFREKYRLVEKEITEVSLGRELGLRPADFVILASIVEKETGAASERPKVASVFINRLRKRMRLQTDPTVIYGLYHSRGYFDGNIRRADLHTPSAYNTYTLPALPLGPIANPGLEAIRAVLHPDQTDYLFFVSYNDGTHFFSRSFAEHNAAVKRLQTAPGVRNGKSWRDLPADQRANR